MLQLASSRVFSIIVVIICCLIMHHQQLLVNAAAPAQDGDTTLIPPPPEEPFGCSHSHNSVLQAQIEADLAKPAPANKANPNKDDDGDAATVGVAAVDDGDLSRRRAASSINWQPVRIRFSALDLYDPLKYCSAAGQVRPDFSGSTRQCTADDVLTTAKRDHIVNVVLPHAVEVFRQAFKVPHMTNGVLVASTDICSGGFKIPTIHTTMGVEQADYVLYVAAGPTTSTTVAWAGPCQKTLDNPRRLVVGRMVINPRFVLNPSSKPDDDLKRTAIHEMLHAFGFYEGWFNVKGLLASKTFRGRTKKALVSPMALQTARNHFNCQTLEGVELEDEGGTGTKHSHLDRRVYKDTIMAGTSGRFLSVMEMAVMQDIGGYQADFTKAERLDFGKNKGCAFLTDACTTAGGGSGTYWCSGGSSSIGCATNLQSYGPCVTFPSLSDGCAYHLGYSNRNCYDTSLAHIPNSGDRFTADSFCYSTANTFKITGGTTPSTVPRCFESRCISGVLSFRVGTLTGVWTSCTVNGAQVSVTGYDGNVVCPADIASFCAAVIGTADQSVVPDATQWTNYPLSAGQVSSRVVSLVMALVFIVVSVCMF